MKLKHYLAREKMSLAAFGRLVGVSRVAVHRYAGGDRMPRPDVMQRIAEATKGAVTANDFHHPTPMAQQNAA